MLYFIFGDDPVLCEDRVKNTLRLLQSDVSEPEIERIDARQVSPAQLGTTLLLTSLFSSHRVVLVQGVVAQSTSHDRADVTIDTDDMASPDDAARPSRGSSVALLKHLQSILPRIPDTTDVLFVDYTRLPPKHGLRRVLEDEQRRRPGQVQLHEVDTLTGIAAREWLKDRASAEGISLDNHAADVLALAWERNMTGAVQEMSKLRSFVGDGGRVTAQIVQALAADPSFTVFQLVDALVQQHPTRAQAALKSVLLQGDDPFRVFFLVVREFRILLYVALGGKTGRATEAALRDAALPVPRWRVRHYEEQARRIGAARLERTFRTLADADGAIKTGNIASSDVTAALHRLVTELSTMDRAATSTR